VDVIENDVCEILTGDYFRSHASRPEGIVICSNKKLSWDDYISLGTSTGSVPECVNNSLLSVVKSALLEHYIAWNGYFGFMNMKSPFYKAYCGETPLTPDSFRQLYPNVKQIKFDPIMEKRTKGLAKRRLNYLYQSTADGTLSWNMETLKHACFNLALRKCGDAFSYNNVLNFELLTGDTRDRNMTLPGFQLALFPDAHPYWDDIKERRFDESGRDYIVKLDLAYWKRQKMRKGYFLAVYDKLCQQK
jgi:hypothetical protein